MEYVNPHLCAFSMVFVKIEYKQSQPKSKLFNYQFYFLHQKLMLAYILCEKESLIDEKKRVSENLNRTWGVYQYPLYIF